MHREPALEVSDLRKSFGRIEAVAGVSFRVAAGEIVGFLGPNGAGKTTTLRILASIFPPTSGEVRVAGHDVMREPLACRRAVGYFPEYAPFYPDLSVRAYLGFVARLKRIPRRARADVIGRALAAFALEPVAHRRVGPLSNGYRRRAVLRVDGPPAEVAAALGAVPGVLAVEPTAGGFVLEGEDHAELARAAGEVVRRHGWTVLELRPEAVGLEEIFLGLVGDGERGS